MADRLHDLVVGLQRMAEGARARSDDLRYIQQRETDAHVEWLGDLLTMVEKVRSVLLQEREAFLPQPERPQQIPQTPQQTPQMQQLPKDVPHMTSMPRVVAKGPREAAG